LSGEDDVGFAAARGIPEDRHRHETGPATESFPARLDMQLKCFDHRKSSGELTNAGSRSPVFADRRQDSSHSDQRQLHGLFSSILQSAGLTPYYEVRLSVELNQCNLFDRASLSYMRWQWSFKNIGPENMGWDGGGCRRGWPDPTVEVQGGTSRNICFFNFNEIWHVGRGRSVMYDGMQYDPIQGQGHEPFKVGSPSIFKSYLLRHF